MKRALLILLGGACARAQAPPVVSPAAPSVQAGGVLQFSANIPVTWSLQAGSAGSINASGLYSAPYIAAQQTLGGCPILPNDHVYNTRIDALPVDSNSTTMLAVIPSQTSTGLGFEVSFPQNIVDASTPLTPLVFAYTPAANGSFPLLAFPYLGVESGYWSGPFGVDRHILSVNRDTCQLSEIYNYYSVGLNSSCPTCNSQSGVMVNFGYALNQGADAAGMYLQPLSLRYSELKAGAINHALRFTLPNGYIQNAIRWPATASTSSATGTIPYGARFRLKSSFDISSFSPTAQVILLALQRYGMFLADGGEVFHIQTMQDASLDNTTWTVLNQELVPGFNPAAPTADDFEIVDESSLEVSPTSGEVNPANGFVVPNGYAIAVATDTSNPSNTTQIPIAIEPVTVGGPLAAQWVQAGMPPFQLPGWSDESIPSGINWSMSPAVGSLTVGGVYTAPSTVSAPTTTTVTLQSVADPSATFSFPLTILPPGVIRIKAANASAGVGVPHSGLDYGPDANGNFWWHDQGASMDYGRSDDWYPESNWGTVSSLFWNRAYAFRDLVYHYTVPNGDYLITLYFSVAASGGSFPRGTYTMNIDTQGSTVQTDFDVCDVTTNCGAYQPGGLTIPVTVTNGNLYFALRQLNTTVTLSAFSIAPVDRRRVLRGRILLSVRTQ